MAIIRDAQGRIVDNNTGKILAQNFEDFNNKRGSYDPVATASAMSGGSTTNTPNPMPTPDESRAQLPPTVSSLPTVQSIATSDKTFGKLYQAYLDKARQYGPSAAGKEYTDLWTYASNIPEIKPQLGNLATYVYAATKNAESWIQQYGLGKDPYKDTTNPQPKITVDPSTVTNKGGVVPPADNSATIMKTIRIIEGLRNSLNQEIVTGMMGRTDGELEYLKDQYAQQLKKIAGDNPQVLNTAMDALNKTATETFSKYKKAMETHKANNASIQRYEDAKNKQAEYEQAHSSKMIKDTKANDIVKPTTTTGTGTSSKPTDVGTMPSNQKPISNEDAQLLWNEYTKQHFMTNGSLDWDKFNAWANANNYSGSDQFATMEKVQNAFFANPTRYGDKSILSSLQDSEIKSQEEKKYKDAVSHLFNIQPVVHGYGMAEQGDADELVRRITNNLEAIKKLSPEEYKKALEDIEVINTIGTKLGKYDPSKQATYSAMVNQAENMGIYTGSLIKKDDAGAWTANSLTSQDQLPDNYGRTLDQFNAGLNNFVVSANQIDLEQQELKDLREYMDENNIVGSDRIKLETELGNQFNNRSTAAGMPDVIGPNADRYADNTDKYNENIGLLPADNFSNVPNTPYTPTTPGGSGGTSTDNSGGTSTGTGTSGSGNTTTPVPTTTPQVDPTPAVEKKPTSPFVFGLTDSGAEQWANYLSRYSLNPKTGADAGNEYKKQFMDKYGMNEGFGGSYQDWSNFKFNQNKNEPVDIGKLRVA